MVNGIPIKEGCLVAIPPYYLHFRDDCWTDPELFNPERFGIVHNIHTIIHSCAHEWERELNVKHCCNEVSQP